VSLRVTRKIRRVLDHLAAQGPDNASGIALGTSISLPALWPVLDRLADAGWIKVAGDRQWSVTALGLDEREAAIRALQAARDATPPPPRPLARVPRPRTPYGRQGRRDGGGR
jgi:hypothetical protein